MNETTVHKSLQIIKILINFSVLTGVILVSIVGCKEKAEQKLVTGSIFISITPGKYGASTERVEILKHNSKYTLRIKRVNTYKEITQEKEIEIPREDFIAAWKIVEKKN